MESAVKISFLGAARNVTGSMHLLSVNGSLILLECGLYQGHREEAFERNRHLPFDARQLDAMVLSHAHIDHSGNIPNLVRSGFQGNIHTTFATRDLCSIMLRDAAHILESDVQYLNKKRARQGLPGLEPIYTAQDATRCLSHFVGVDYGRPMLIAPGVQVTFFDAGHILGSAVCVLDITEGHHQFRLLFTGDLGRKDLPILRDPQVVPDVDYLITESTYGARLHPTPDEAAQELKRVVNENWERGGKIIIPAFSVGRTQEIVYTLHVLRDQDAIPPIPVYVDSPLSTNATDIFRLHPEYYDAEAFDFVRNREDPFGFSGLYYIRDVEESKALNERTDPMIIISASGMCEAGRILHHLKNNIENSRNTVLFVSFQAENTLGRRILDGSAKVSIFGEAYQVKARIERIEGYSAHADREELLDYVAALGAARIRAIFVVHGDEEASFSLAEGLTALGVSRVVVPSPGDQARI
jgi:metallo-beta-lactamase family protein